MQYLVYLLVCGPLALSLAAWIVLYLERRRRLGVIAFIALSMVSVNAALAAGNFLYFYFRPPSPSLPPWKDPETLTFGMLFFLAPIGMILGFIAGERGAPKWLIWLVEIASMMLFVIGLLASFTV